eukprot:917328-Amphidinium_carterae.2
MAYNNLAIPTTFLISNVNCVILGFDTSMRHGLCLTVDGFKCYLGNDQTEVKLHIGNHFYLKATMGFTTMSTTLSWYYEWHDDFKQENKIHGLHQQDLQQVPICRDYIIGDQSQPEAKASTVRTLKTPTAPTQK